MQNILVMGAGKIDILVAFLLQDSKDYQVFSIDRDFSHGDAEALFTKKYTLICMKF